MYDSETMKWKDKEKSRIRIVQMDNLRDLLGIRKMDKVPNAQVKELCGVTKGMDERIDEGILRWFGPGDKMENYMIVKRVYVAEYMYMYSRSVGRTRKMWIDTKKDC